MTTTAIGFANKFYTLWNIIEEDRPLGNGRTYHVVHHIYVKNISMDKSTALAKYPEAIFDENLRGHFNSFDTEKIVWDNVDTFRFGKYSDMKIRDCKDFNYLEWYWNSDISSDHKDYITEYMIENGYELRTWGDGNTYLVSPEVIKNEKIYEVKLSDYIAKAKDNIPVELFIESNPDMEGYVRVDDMMFKFNEVKENWYRGFDYYLPVLNGKAKRIKNKTILATIKHTGSDFFDIVDFKII